MLACFFQAAWANAVSPDMPMTSASRSSKSDKPEMLHICSVQTPVNAAGKKRRTTFFFPRKELRVIVSRPFGPEDGREKSGAISPTLSAMTFDSTRYFWVESRNFGKVQTELGLRSSDR